jgi:hypothetical protein
LRPIRTIRAECLYHQFGSASASFDLARDMSVDINTLTLGFDIGLAS